MDHVSQAPSSAPFCCHGGDVHPQHLGLQALAAMTLSRHGPACVRGTPRLPQWPHPSGRQRPVAGLQGRTRASSSDPDSTDPQGHGSHPLPPARQHSVQAPPRSHTINAHVLGLTKPLGVALLLVAGLRLVRKVRQVVSGLPPPRPLQSGRCRVGVVWLRNDLRLHDHEALVTAAQECDTVLPVYCFDPREVAPQGPGSSPFPRCSPQRAAFILSSLSDLRQRLKGLGSDLVVRVGRPEEVVPGLARRVGAARVYCHGEVTHEDVQVEQGMSHALQRVGATLQCFWGGCTLYHKDDLPTMMSQAMPDYAAFRSQVDHMRVREPLPAPTCLAPWPAELRLDPGPLPSLTQLGFNQAATHAPTRQPEPSEAAGGETQALLQLRQFVTRLRHTSHEAQAGSNTDTAQLPLAHGGQLAVLTPPAQAQHAQSKALSRMAVDQQQEQQQQRQQQQQQHQPADDLCRAQGWAGAMFARHISPWLALGCLSPRQMHHELASGQAAEASDIHQATQAGAQPQCTPGLRQHWLVYELLWRDFFRLIMHKYSHQAPVQTTSKDTTQQQQKHQAAAAT